MEALSLFTRRAASGILSQNLRFTAVRTFAGSAAPSASGFVSELTLSFIAHISSFSFYLSLFSIVTLYTYAHTHACLAGKVGDYQPTDGDQATGYERLEQEKGLQYWDSMKRFTCIDVIVLLMLLLLTKQREKNKKRAFMASLFSQVIFLL